MIIGLLGKAGSGKDSVAAMIAPVHPVWMDGQWVDIEVLVHETAAKERKKTALKARAVQMALADPLKVICREVYDFSYMQLWGPSAERNKPDERYPRRHVPGPMPDDDPRCRRCGRPLSIEVCSHLTPREALQTLGTEWARERYANTWIDLGVRRAQGLTNGHRIRRPADVEHFASSYVIERTELVIFSDVRFRNEVLAIREAGGEVWKIKRPEAGLTGMAGAHLSETEQDGIDEVLFDHVLVNDGTLDDLRARCAGLV
jgi:hypothetical protein